MVATNIIHSGIGQHKIQVLLVLGFMWVRTWSKLRINHIITHNWQLAITERMESKFSMKVLNIHKKKQSLQNFITVEIHKFWYSVRTWIPHEFVLLLKHWLEKADLIFSINWIIVNPSYMYILLTLYLWSFGCTAMAVSPNIVSTRVVATISFSSAIRT